MSNNVSISRNSKHSKKSVIDSVLEYESVVIFGGVGCLILGTIIITGIFQSGPTQRATVFYNAAGAICMGFGFIYIIFKFMGNKVIIFDQPYDVGMFIYIAIILFVMFVLGN